MGKSLVIVESPAKAKTIEKYLGDGFRVLPSVGHVRDLPQSAEDIPAAVKKEPWARLGVNVEKGFEPLYIVPAAKQAQLRALKESLATADALYLATDEDREGEAISWHLLEVLKPRVPVRRLVFNEITKAAIQRALQKPRDIDQNLVRAQETRRILDRLVGYEVSPLLWKKVRPQLSAGRVQSPAVRMLVERERARMAFRSASWWDVTAALDAGGVSFDASVVAWQGERLATGKDFDDRGQVAPGVRVLDEAVARAVAAALPAQVARVQKVEEKPFTERPAAPFTTSTLQQEAIRKLRWSSRDVMKVAQVLYETGWITYMRTDSTTLSDEALQAARGLIGEAYGAEYLPREPRRYANKVKNAQEAHEAVRPAGARFRSLSEAAAELSANELKLYTLIWKRTVASQMVDAVGRQVSIHVEAGPGALVARGRTIDFPGFRRAYVEDSDTPEADLAEQDRVLPAVAVGARLPVRGAEARGHETRPPARLTEASLVKELEARGIGRPSTYSSIIDTVLGRGYAFKKAGALVPTFTAFAVTRLMEEHLPNLVDYDFTARMEQQLDDIAGGEGDWKKYLGGFFLGDAGLKRTLSQADAAADPRAVCGFALGSRPDDGVPVEVRVGRYGPFLSAGEDRASLPGDLPPDEVTVERAVQLLAEKKEGPLALGTDPDSGDTVYLMNGRFGPYVQLGIVEDPKSKEKPRRASLLPGQVPGEIDLGVALALLSLPRDLGPHPETGEPIEAANGRFGPYLRSGKESRSLPRGVSVLEVSLEQAVAILAQPAVRRGGAEVLGELGTDPRTGRTLRVMKGRFGPYVTDGETNATLPRDADPGAFSLAEAAALVEAREGAPKREKPGRKGKAAGAPKEPAAAAPKSKAAPKPKAESPAKPASTAKAAAKSAPVEPPAAASAEAPKVVRRPRGKG